MLLHERHKFHLAVATDGAKRGGTKDRMETQRLSGTTYGVCQGPTSTEIIRAEREKTSESITSKVGDRAEPNRKRHAVEPGVLSGRLGDSATSAEAVLFAIFAILRKVQAQRILGHYGKEKARVWRENKNNYQRLQNGAVLEAITNARETLGTVIFMWIPSHVGIVPNTFADGIAAKEQTEAPNGMITEIMSKQVKSRPVIDNRKVKGQVELADGPI
eukprot:6212928-Pleurochrysis_carterae.AAC.1